MQIQYIFFALKNIFYFPWNYTHIIDEQREDSRCLFVDISDTFRNDTGTGIPRVSKNVIASLHEKNLAYTIVEIYTRVAPVGFYNCKTKKPIRVKKGDIFLFLEPARYAIAGNKLLLDKLYRYGIPLYFFVHDLLPLCYPQYFPKRSVIGFRWWMKIIINYTGLIANSKSTLDEIKQYIEEHPSLPKNKNIQTTYVHLGSVFSQKPLPVPSAADGIEKIALLAVSTVEPRKRYDQIVGACELLWEKGIDMQLTIVGKPGWKNKTTIARIRSSPYLNHKLFWYDSYISDAELNALYENCSALIFASEGEGFGLAIMEAAAYNKPLILRDIPIFREVSGDGAFFFNGFTCAELADALETWITSYKDGVAPLPHVRFTTWKECTDNILQILGIE
ncbi:MAG: glycosyltransferase family 4 protein [Treponema sp.]|nr:glycosyltransferase family 4 protein [Treponema sp.]